MFSTYFKNILFIYVFIFTTMASTSIVYSESLISEKKENSELSEEKAEEKIIDPELRFKVAFYFTLMTLIIVIVLIFKIKQMEKNEAIVYEYKKLKNK